MRPHVVSLCLWCAGFIGGIQVGAIVCEKVFMVVLRFFRVLRLCHLGVASETLMCVVGVFHPFVYMGRFCDCLRPWYPKR